MVDWSDGAFRNLQSIDARLGASMKLFDAHKLKRNIWFSMSCINSWFSFSVFAYLSNSWAHSAALEAIDIAGEWFWILTG